MEKGPEPDAATGPNTREPERYCIRLRSGLDALYTDEVIGWRKRKKDSGLNRKIVIYASF